MMTAAVAMVVAVGLCSRGQNERGGGEGENNGQLGHWRLP